MSRFPWSGVGHGLGSYNARTICDMKLRRIAVAAVAACTVSALGMPSRGLANAPERASDDFVVYRVETKDPVVFVTIDDGFFKTPEAMADIKRLGWPVSSFVLPRPLSQNVPYFKAFGSTVEFGNHTYSHTSLKRRSFKFQKHEICRGANAVGKLTGTRPALLRPPFGAWDTNTVEAAKSCGMEKMVLWKVVVSGNEIATWGGPIRRGDIILLHYRPSLATSLEVLDEALRKQGLRPALLGDYLK